VWFNHIEAQQVPGIIEVVVDEEAAIKKKQHEALASLLGPIGDKEFAYAHICGSTQRF
jgi:hypothetical protein